MAHCANCGAENPEDLIFCHQCGAKLPAFGARARAGGGAPDDDSSPQPPAPSRGKSLCPSCGTESPVEFKFCLSCGTELPPPGAVPAGPPVLYPPGFGPPPPELPARRSGTNAAPGAPRRSPAGLVFVALGILVAAGVFVFLRTGGKEPPWTAPDPEPPTLVVEAPPVPPIPSPAAPLAESAEPPATARNVVPLDPPVGSVTPDAARPGVEAAPTAGADSGLPTTPPRDVVRSTFESARDAIRACVAGGSGIALTLTSIDGATGRVTRVEVTGDFSGSTVACVESAIRGLTFPPFSQATLTVNYPFRF